MELRHLRYFAAVAETLNFSRAADRLHVAQSALSRQIRHLEDEIGFKLFVRTTSSVRLTDAGRVFLQSTQKLLGQLASAITTAQAVAKGTIGELNIASDWRIPMDLVPKTVQKFRHQNPKVTVNFVDLAVADQIEALRAGDIHLAFLPDLAIGAAEDFETMHVYTSDVVVVMSTSHPLANAPTVRLRELRKETWIVGQDKPRRSDFRTFMLQLCRPAGFSPVFGRTATSATGLLTLVGAGEGVGLLPELVIPRDFDGVRLVKTDCPPMKMYAVWLNKEPAPLIRRYLDALQAEMKVLFTGSNAKTTGSRTGAVLG